MASRLEAFLAGISSGSDTVEDPETNGGEGASSSSTQKKSSKVQIAFSFDTTGSMYPYLAAVKAQVQTSIAALLAQIPLLEIALIAHGDFADYENYVLKYVDFTSDLEELDAFLDSVGRTGGGDDPECYEYALHVARTELAWDPECSARGVVLIGDDVPHPPSYTSEKIDWRAETDALVADGVKVYAVHVGGKEAAAPFYEELAESSGGFLLHLTEMEWMPIMFVGLCYRSSSLEDFENYRMELIWGKKLTHDSPLNTLFLEMSTPTIVKANPNYTAHFRLPWWDAGFDVASSPQFLKSGPDTDDWKPAPGSEADIFSSSSSSSSRRRTRRRQHRNQDQDDDSEDEDEESSGGNAPPSSRRSYSRRKPRKRQKGL